MGRTFLADERLLTYVEGLLKSNTWYLGLIVGKFTNQKDYVLHLVRTPEPVEDQASDDDDCDDDANGNADDADKLPKERSPKKPKSLESMNELWAATHSKQVTTMLTGGLNVIGIFALAPPKMIQNAEAKLRQILFAIHKQEKKSVQQVSTAEISDRVLLQICSNTKKFTCKTIDVSDPKSAFRPADWKFSPLSDKWTKLECNVAVKIPIDIPVKSTGNLAKQLQTGLQPFYSRINSSMVLIQNCLRNGNELLDQSTEKRHNDKKSKGKDKSTAQQSYRCKVISKMSVSDKADKTVSTDPVITECSTELVIKGSIHCRAYVTGKPTVDDAVNAIKQDVLRSVSSRCELMCDDLQLVEEDAERQEVYSTPRRVFFTLPGTSLDLCDYMFQDEKVSEVIKRIQELLDITVTEDDLDLTCEQPATEEDCSLYKQADVVEEILPKEIVQSAKSFKYYIMAGVGGFIGIIAAGLSYILSENT